MQFPDVASDYLNHIRHEKNLAASTCLHYQCWLRHYSNWIEENRYESMSLDVVFTVTVLRRYMYAKSREGVRPRTILSAFHGLRGLGEFLVKQGVLSENPVKKLTMPKVDAAVRLTITDEKVRTLFDGCDRLVKPRQCAMAKAARTAPRCCRPAWCRPSRGS